MYYLTFLLLFLVVLLGEKLDKRLKLFLILVPLLIIISVRYGVGADYFSYQNIYESISINSSDIFLSDGERIESGFLLILSIFKSFGLSYKMVVILLNTIVLSFAGIWIYKESEDSEISWLLYYSIFFFVWVLSAYRQGLVLAIGTYLVFTSKKSDWLKVILILLLSTIHITALYYLFLLLLTKFSFNKKSHLIALVISLIVTILPINSIIQMLSNLPFLSILKRYQLNSSVGFFDFQSMIRLMMYFGVIIFYDDIKRSSTKNYIDTFLVGFYVYFILKFSETIAARMFIYTFILCVVIFPVLYRVLKEKLNGRKLVKILPVLLFIFSSLYFFKELRTMAIQSGMNEFNVYVPFTTENNSDYSNFDNVYSFILERERQIEERYDEYSDNDDIENRHIESYSEKNNYALVNYSVGTDTHSGIISQNGNWLLKGKYNPNLSLHENVLFKRADHGLFGELQYFDLSSEGRTFDEMSTVVKEYEINKLMQSYAKEEIMDIESNDLPQEVRNIFRDESEIVGIRMSKNIYPFTSYIIEIDYYFTKNPSYLYLDEKMNLILDFPVTHRSRYDIDGFLRIDTNSGEMIINKNGEVIWWR